MKIHLVLILALVAMFGEIGCKSTPNAISYNTTAATVATVDAGMQAWADYVHQQHARMAALPLIDQGAQNSQLLVIEGRVREAYGRYQSALAAANVGVTAADNSPVAPEVAGAAAALLSVIHANVKH